MILITGATGFLGKALIKRLGGNIRVVSRNEGELIKLQQEYPNIEIVTGDISDEFIARKSVEGVDEIYHLAAFKHVGLAEEQTRECIKSNIIGTINLLEHFRGKLFVAISTDKAAQVRGVYGATKLLMEKVIAEYERLNPKIKYRVVRYGNVLYSTGSVLCKWRDLIEKGKDLIITNPRATRFFWTIEQAVDHIFDCIKISKNANPFIPKMKAMSVGDLVEAIMQKYGRVDIKEIGLQAGENMHETMDGILFSDEVEQYSVNEIKKLI